ncbi:Glutamine synthetase [Melia azedarach]|uniref:Glutamine synthetase n=1 Tax=Melia azedarach TaxID=155640 RepID=A0ACC1YFP8_MELAZ|nr:Glutamine synthetase [Melia azedarach]
MLQIISGVQDTFLRELPNKLGLFCHLIQKPIEESMKQPALNHFLGGVANRGCSIRVGVRLRSKAKSFHLFQIHQLLLHNFWIGQFLVITTSDIADPLGVSLLFMVGYLEDRRPASNMDPYVVTSLLAETTILWEPTLEAEALAAQKLALNV